MKKYKNKKQRLLAIIEAFRAAKKLKLGSAFNLDDVSKWAISKNLWPVPDKNSSQEACLNWETRLNQAVEAKC